MAKCSCMRLGVLSSVPRMGVSLSLLYIKGKGDLVHERVRGVFMPSPGVSDDVSSVRAGGVGPRHVGGAGLLRVGRRKLPASCRQRELY